MDVTCHFFSVNTQVQLLHCIEQCQGEGGDNEFSDGFHVAHQLKESNYDAYKLLTTIPIDSYDIGIDAYRFYMAARHVVIR